MARDYYDILGIDRRASDKEVKAAYRQKARQFHPDVTGEDLRATERFKEVSEAYECLSDPTRRRAYDLFGHPDSEGGLSELKDGIQQVVESLGDLFQRKAPRQPEPGTDEEVTLRVTFTEAYEGTHKEIEAELLRPCGDCQGTGREKLPEPTDCPDCGGTGRSRIAGALPIKKTCMTCQGSGQSDSRSCRKCAGRSRRVRKERLKVGVPAGVADNARLRLKGRGGAGAFGGTPGDLYVRLEVSGDPTFFREKDDLHTQVRVGLKEAIVGGQVDVPLPVGSARMVVPPGTQGGQVFRLKGKGFPRLSREGKGDLYVSIQLRIPKTLDDESQSLLEKLSERIEDL